MAVKQLDETYRKVTTALQESVKGEADAIKEGDFGKDLSPTFELQERTHDAIRKAFSRDGLAAEYMKSLDTQQLKDSDIQRLVMQNDVLAGIEKAFRLRARSRVELLAGGAARAAGTSSDKGFTKYALANLPLISEG